MFLRYAGMRPVVVHGGGPQITAHLDRLGIETRVRGRPPGHHARDDGRRPDGARRPGAARDRRADQRARPVRGRALRRGRATCSPPSRATSMVDGEAVDLGLVGDVVEVDPGVVQGLRRRRPDPGRRPRVARGRRPAADLQRQRRHGRRRARGRAAAPRSSSCSPTSRASTPTGRPTAASRRPMTSSQHHGRRARGAAADAVDRDGAEDGGLPARRARRGAEGARHRRPGAARAARRGLHRRGRRHRGAP